MVNIVKKCEKGNLSENEKNELVQDLKEIVKLVEPFRFIVIENSDMLNKMTNNTDYALRADAYIPDNLMSDLYIKDYNSLSEDEKKYRDEEKRILFEMNKYVIYSRYI